MHNAPHTCLCTSARLYCVSKKHNRISVCVRLFARDLRVHNIRKLKALRLSLYMHQQSGFLGVVYARTMKVNAGIFVVCLKDIRYACVG